MIRERLIEAETRDFIAEIARERPRVGGSPLARYFDSFSDDLKKMRLSDFNEIVNLFEVRRQTFSSNVSVLVAGVFGGVIGASLTALIPVAIGINAEPTLPPKLVNDNGSSVLEGKSAFEHDESNKAPVHPDVATPGS